jgi:hypothetical protein
MKVYVIERFTDYESSQITKVFGDMQKAWKYCAEEIRKIQNEYYPTEAIETLPSGYRIGSRGVIFQVKEVE